MIGVRPLPARDIVNVIVDRFMAARGEGFAISATDLETRSAGVENVAGNDAML